MKIGGLVGNGLSPSNEKAMASVSLLVRASRGRSPLHSPHMILHPSQLPLTYLADIREMSDRAMSMRCIIRGAMLRGW